MKESFVRPIDLATQIALLPFIYPTTCATEYFGGIETNM